RSRLPDVHIPAARDIPEPSPVARPLQTTACRRPGLSLRFGLPLEAPAMQSASPSTSARKPHPASQAWPPVSPYRSALKPPRPASRCRLLRSPPATSPHPSHQRLTSPRQYLSGRAPPFQSPIRSATGKRLLIRAISSREDQMYSVVESSPRALPNRSESPFASANFPCSI